MSLEEVDYVAAPDENTECYEGLTSDTADGAVQPAVAKSWVVRNDGLT